MSQVSGEPILGEMPYFSCNLNTYLPPEFHQALKLGWIGGKHPRWHMQVD